MNQEPIPAETSEAAVLDALQHELAATRSVLRLSLISSLAAYFGVASFMGHQVWQSNRELVSREVVLQQVRAEEVRMDGLIERLREFGAAHSDYQAILMRTGFQSATDAAPAILTGPPPTLSGPKTNAARP